MDHEIRSLPTGDLQVRSVGGSTRITGYAAVFGHRSQDLGGFVEEITPGAFKRVANDAGHDVLALYDHDSAYLLGRRSAGTLKLSEDARGLHYEVDVNPSDPLAVSVAARVERGDIQGSSFSFKVAPSGDTWGLTDSNYPLRTVGQVAAVRDVGPVAYPAYPDTTAGMRSALAGLAEQRGLNLDALVESAKTHRLADVLTGEPPELVVARAAIPDGFWDAKRAQIDAHR